MPRKRSEDNDIPAAAGCCQYGRDCGALGAEFLCPFGVLFLRFRLPKEMPMSSGLPVMGNRRLFQREIIHEQPNDASR
jgi:hypothetical protein